MATKNIFEFLDSDAEEQQQKTQNKAPRQRQRKQNQEQLGQKVQNEVADRNRKEVDNKHRRPYNNNNRQQGGDNRPPRRNRSKDRHVSGTGRGTQQRNFRKDGAGRGNVGTVKDVQQRETEQQPEPEVESSEEEEEEKEDENTVTFDQYFSNVQEKSDVKRVQNNKVDQADLQKEKLTIVSSKKPIQRGNNKQAKQQNLNYKPVYQGELGEQIAFKTGLVPEKKAKKPKQTAEVPAEGAEQQAEQKTEEKPRQQRNNNNRNNNNNNNQQRRPQQKKGKGFQGGQEDFPGL